MNKEEYIKLSKDRIKNKTSRKIMLEQIERFYSIQKATTHNSYKIGDRVYLKKGTLLHGTYKNIEGLEQIAKEGLISSWFIESRGTKYPSSVGVWNLKKGSYLDEYINYYSGGTIRYREENKNEITEVIPYSDMKNIMNHISKKNYFMWQMEQTKEARFLPSLVQDKIQIGIIFSNNKELLKGDILNPDNINDKDVEEFVNDQYYKQFIIDRKNKNDFFTDRESAILLGIPKYLIEGIIVGKRYEKNNTILNRIKKLLPNCYICNINGIVIK